MQFGSKARLRYKSLLKAAFKDLSSSPLRQGSAQRDEIDEGLRSYHLLHSRKQVMGANGRVQKPRPIVFYRQAKDQVIEIVRILHDTMEVSLHFP